MIIVITEEDSVCALNMALPASINYHCFLVRTNPATRVESWKLDFIEDIHRQQSQEAAPKSRASSPSVSDGNR